MLQHQMGKMWELESGEYTGIFIKGVQVTDQMVRRRAYGVANGFPGQR
jgi:hypothetical protein